jgi:hypothetical protein
MKLKPDPMDALDRIHSLKAMLEALAKIDASFLEEHRRQTGKPYMLIWDAAANITVESSPDDVWHDIPSIVSLGRANLRDLACWRIAELRASGKDAAPMLVSDARGFHYVKIRIDDEDGVVRFEDPADIVSAASRRSDQ